MVQFGFIRNLFTTRGEDLQPGAACRSSEPSAALDIDRGSFHRLQAAVYFRPLGILSRTGSQVDPNAGGIRVYSDEKHKRGDRIRMEIVLPDRTWLTLTGEILWIEALASDAPARFDVGVGLVEPPPDALSRLGAGPPAHEGASAPYASVGRYPFK